LEDIRGEVLDIEGQAPMLWIDFDVTAVLEIRETLFVALEAAESRMGKAVRKRLEVHLADRADRAAAVDDQTVVLLGNFEVMDGVLMEILIAGEAHRRDDGDDGALAGLPTSLQRFEMKLVEAIPDR
jgi:hypothetical protein